MGTEELHMGNFHVDSSGKTEEQTEELACCHPSSGETLRKEDGI
jgi:hypothetical protein